jgi:hypothetical protein
MRKIPCLAVALCALLAAPAGAEAEKARSHGYSVSGTVIRVDTKAKTFTVVSGDAREIVLVRTSATRVSGSKLQAGERVTVRWIDRNGRKTATAIRIEPRVIASATPAAPSGAR